MSTEQGLAKRSRKRSTQDGTALSLELIIAAALEQIDNEGLETFSLRTLSQRLGVYPTAIYWYVPTRNELLAQVVSHILSKVQPQKRRRSWQQLLRDLFANFRAAVAAHPNAAPLIGTALVSNTTMSFGFVESILAILTRVGLTGPQLVGAYNSIIAALVGFVAQEFAPIPSEDRAAWQISVQERLLGIDRDAFPLLSANLNLLSNHAFILRWQNGSDAPLEDSYAIFTDVVIAGVAALADSNATAPTQP